LLYSKGSSFLDTSKKRTADFLDKELFSDTTEARSVALPFVMDESDFATDSSIAISRHK
jgi:hypothetical protein